MSNVLVIGDLHCPADHKGYLSFCLGVQEKYKCNQIVFIGDIIDLESISMHDKNPELPSPFDEYSASVRHTAVWYKAFPKAKVCIGNHDNRVYKKCFKEGIPPQFLRSFKDLYNTPGWDWGFDFTIDRTLFTHGDGWGGKTPALNAAISRFQSVVCGHHHSVANINWIQGPNSYRLLGMNVGCGIDVKHKALLYTKPHLKKPILSCGVVINNHPYLEVM